MYCPSCGVEDAKSSQFCRACGAELSSLRATLEQRPDTNPLEANSAREEIGRALAEKIRQSESAADLRLVITDILPVAERFLETPEEKRLRTEQIGLENAQTALRRARRGTVVTAIGFAAALIFLVVGLASRDPVWLVGGIPSIMVFLIGAGILLNALFFTPLPATPSGSSQPKRSIEEILWGKKGDPRRQAALPAKKETGPADHSALPSVTEGTTRNL
jgi:hypothetical protein